MQNNGPSQEFKAPMNGTNGQPTRGEVSTDAPSSCLTAMSITSSPVPPHTGSIRLRRRFTKDPCRVIPCICAR